MNQFCCADIAMQNRLQAFSHFVLRRKIKTNVMYSEKDETSVHVCIHVSYKIYIYWNAIEYFLYEEIIVCMWLIKQQLMIRKMINE